MLLLLTPETAHHNATTGYSQTLPVWSPTAVVRSGENRDVKEETCHLSRLPVPLPRFRDILGSLEMLH